MNKSEDSTEFQKKSSFSKKIKITQTLSHELKQQFFCQNFFLIQKFDYRSTNGKRNWVSALSSSEIHYLSIGQGLIL